MLTHRLQRVARASLFRRSLHVPATVRAVSFTFDDCPRSALTEGGAILRRFGFTGTYYVSLGSGDMYHDEPKLSASDLRTLVAQGHEVACHSFAHEACSERSTDAFVRSLSRNRRAIQASLPGYECRSFAYPFGGVTVGAKRVVRQRFVTGRGIRDGINVGRVDATSLLANRLYSRTVPIDRVRRLLDDVGRWGGWIVFYTHDVRKRPSAYGCTPEVLESVAAQVAASDMVVLPVAAIVERILAAKPRRPSVATPGTVVATPIG